MNAIMQTNLCHGLRACGLPKPMTYELLNTIITWYDSCGPEWTNSRIKDIRQWYETYLGGEPQPPSWHAKTKNGLPKGIFGRLFKEKNTAKVLAALSANTVFVEDSLSDTQRKKFLDAVQGRTGTSVWKHSNVVEIDQGVDAFTRWVLDQPGCIPHTWRFPALHLPTLSDMTGSSIPIGRQTPLHLELESERGKGKTRKHWAFGTETYEHQQGIALIKSWQSLPRESLEYLDRSDHLDWIPEEMLNIGDSAPRRRPSDVVGRIGIIQEPELKARTVANPNRVSQVLTRPLGTIWYEVLRSLPTDGTFDQESAVLWVQKQLQSGIELAGSDLSSATDLLDLDFSLEVANYLSRKLLRTEHTTGIDNDYDLAVEHFKQLSRGTWTTPKSSDLGDVVWTRGQPLGLYPSFALLGLTNNALAAMAAIQCGYHDLENCFRVVGDDVIMIADIEPTYTRLVECVGGVINHSKTLRSAQVAEFAGNIITPSRVMRKKYKFKDPSDESFMQYVADLGPQAKCLLRPRQRKVWDVYGFVPGCAYPGPWNPNSQGIPLVRRVEWVESLKIIDPTPDPEPTRISEEQLLTAATRILAGREATVAGDLEKDLPYPVEGDFQSPIIIGQRRSTGDPRSRNGKSTLERLETHRNSYEKSNETKAAWLAAAGKMFNVSVDELPSSFKAILKEREEKVNTDLNPTQTLPEKDIGIIQESSSAAADHTSIPGGEMSLKTPNLNKGESPGMSDPDPIAVKVEGTVTGRDVHSTVSVGHKSSGSTSHQSHSPSLDKTKKEKNTGKNTGSFRDRVSDIPSFDEFSPTDDKQFE